MRLTPRTCLSPFHDHPGERKLTEQASEHHAQTTWMLRVKQSARRLLSSNSSYLGNSPPVAVLFQRWILARPGNIVTARIIMQAIPLSLHGWEKNVAYDRLKFIGIKKKKNGSWTNDRTNDDHISHIGAINRKV